MKRWTCCLRPCRVSAFAAVVLFSAPLLGLAADQEESEPTSSGTSSQTAAAPAPAGPGKLQIHGFLSQAFAVADFAEGGFQRPTSDEVVLGIPEDVTSDYRTLAIQIRYEFSPRDSAIFQISHRRFGDSPIAEVEDDLELDWAFYQRKFGNGSYVKVGRIQIPLGLLNEVRDVGTQLPFFRAPFGFYREGSFTSETVDGLLFGHGFGGQESSWDTTLDVYYGGFDVIEFPIPGTEAEGASAVIARAEKAAGFQLDFAAPLSGLRFGVGANRHSPSGGFLEAPGTETDWWGWNVYGEASRERFVARAEVRKFFPEANAPFIIEDDVTGYYLQLGFHANSHWRFYVQYEGQRSNERFIEFLAEPVSFTFFEDTAAAVNYVVRNNVIVKLEHHRVDIGTFSVVPVFPPEGGPPQLFGVTKTATDGRQTILSLSMSF